MGIRSKRITGLDLPAGLAAYQNRIVQVITWSGHTYLGRLKAVKADHLIVQDLNAYWYNRKWHTHAIALDEVREVVVDEQARW
jgi:hypothetical protein